MLDLLLGILQKLLWYRLTQKSSTQQWRDVLNILKLQQSNLDFAYLQEWAKVLKLSTELKQAFQESNNSIFGQSIKFQTIVENETIVTE